ncbi:hypothetical protein ACFE04_024550 [Oxalis oulophora]
MKIHIKLQTFDDGVTLKSLGPHSGPARSLPPPKAYEKSIHSLGTLVRVDHMTLEAIVCPYTSYIADLSHTLNHRREIIVDFENPRYRFGATFVVIPNLSSKISLRPY